MPPTLSCLPSGESGHFYCGTRSLTCPCCDGLCGPGYGCNCGPCRQLDAELGGQLDTELAGEAAETGEPAASSRAQVGGGGVGGKGAVVGKSASAAVLEYMMWE